MVGGSWRSPRAGAQCSPPRSSRAWSRAAALAAAPIASPKCSQQPRHSPSLSISGLSQGTQLGIVTVGAGDAGRAPPACTTAPAREPKGDGGAGGGHGPFGWGTQVSSPAGRAGQGVAVPPGDVARGWGGQGCGGKWPNSLCPPSPFRRRLGPNPALCPHRRTPILGRRQPQPVQRKHSGEGGSHGAQGPHPSSPQAPSAGRGSRQGVGGAWLPALTPLALGITTKLHPLSWGRETPKPSRGRGSQPLRGNGSARGGCQGRGMAPKILVLGRGKRAPASLSWGLGGHWGPALQEPLGRTPCPLRLNPLAELIQMHSVKAMPAAGGSSWPPGAGGRERHRSILLQASPPCRNGVFILLIWSEAGGGKGGQEHRGLGGPGLPGGAQGGPSSAQSSPQHQVCTGPSKQLEASWLSRSSCDQKRFAQSWG